MDPITNLDLLRHAHPRRHPAPAVPRPPARRPRPGARAILRAVLALLLRRTALGD